MMFVFQNQGFSKSPSLAFASAKKGGVKRTVFVSVSSEVMSCEENWLPEFFGELLLQIRAKLALSKHHKQENLTLCPSLNPNLP